MKTAIIFPGQGSQHIGMGQVLLETNPIAETLFERASKTLNRNMKKLCLEGPEEDLKRTDNAQLAIFLVAACQYERLKSLNMTADLLAGHSLGEITAYYVSGVIDFETALHIIDERGRAMVASAQKTESGMAAVLGTDFETVRNCLKKSSENIVIANDNCPGQLVISGPKADLALVTEKLKEAGAKRVIPLNVMGAFHSPLMAPAAEKFKTAIASIEFNNAETPIILNRTAAQETNFETLKENLPLQICSDVRFRESILTMQNEGITRWIECGPGNILTGLVKKTATDPKIITLSNLKTQEELKEALSC